MLEPEEIDERLDEQAAARVAAVDVAKASGVVCTRVPRDGEPGADEVSADGLSLTRGGS